MIIYTIKRINWVISGTDFHLDQSLAIANIIVLSLGVLAFWVLGVAYFIDFTEHYSLWLMMYEIITIINEVILCVTFHKIGNSFKNKH